MAVFRVLLASLLVLGAMVVAPLAQEKASVQIGLSQETVEISSSFSGTEVVIFGSIENGDRALLDEGRYDIAVVLEGPTELATVRRRERKLGVWVNGTKREFADVPSSYSVATTRPFAEMSNPEEASILQLGLSNINYRPVSDAENASENATFRESLTRLKKAQDLYLERIGGISFLTPTLFKAKLAVPANVPIGSHTARAFLFLDGKFVNSQFTELRVQKIGLEQFTYTLAHENSLLYGILAVLIAMGTGWLASVILRKD